MTKLEATPYHENTKLACRLSGGLARRYFGWVRKHERRGGYIEQQTLFRLSWLLHRLKRDCGAGFSAKHGFKSVFRAEAQVAPESTGEVLRYSGIFVIRGSNEPCKFAHKPRRGWNCASNEWMWRGKNGETSLFVSPFGNLHIGMSEPHVDPVNPV